MERHHWCLSALGIICCMSFLAVEMADHPLPILIFSSIAAIVILIYAIRYPKKIESLPPQPETIIEYVPDTARLRLLNDARTELYEKGLLLDHFIEENKKRELLLEESNETILQLQVQLDQHPAQIAYRELRKQFAEKSEALHRMRQQMFSLEGQLLALQWEQEESDGERTEEMSQLMQKLGEAEEECEILEEVIAFLQNQVKPASKKRTRKPSPLQSELFAAIPTVARNRKKSTSSVYFGAVK